MRMILALVASLCLAQALPAGDPKPFIEGPSTAIAGQLVTLDASKSEDVLHYKWREISPNIPGRRVIEVDSDQKKVRIATYPGRYLIELLVGNADGVDAITHELIVSGDCPPDPKPPVPPGPPTPDPQPTPVPPNPSPVDPVFPPGEFSVSADVYKWATAVSSPGRIAEAQACAVAGDSLAAQIAAGTLRGEQQILNGIGSVFTSATSANAAAWSGFRKLLSDRVKEIYLGGKLRSPTDWAALIREVSLGLKAVK